MLFAFFLQAPAQAAILYTGNPFSPADSYGLAPFWDWKQIESKNFRVIFPKELTDVAQKATQYLEESSLRLFAPFSMATSLQSADSDHSNQDAGNGVTDPMARFGIILWATPPDSWFGTAFYDNWLRFLVFHEYTHFMNMDTTYDAWEYLRYVFGDTLLPNAAWPPWMLEGLAVFDETQFTRSGRGRSSDYDMTLRAAVEEKVLGKSDFITLDEINGTNPYYPGGDTRYQFGYHLMNEIANSPFPEKLLTAIP